MPMPDGMRAAETLEEATHRYPTSVHWGAGYFNDGMRYVVAHSALHVAEHVRQFGLSLDNVQVNNCGKWSWVS